MAEAGAHHQHPQRRGIASPRGKLWGKTSVHAILINEAYTGTMIWGANAKDNAEPVRVEKAFPAIITKAQFGRVGKLMRARAPKTSHPPKGRKHLPAQRIGQVQGVQQGAQRPGRQERPVLLLRLPVDHEARQERLRYPQAQRPPLRADDRRQDSLQHPHRGEHHRAGEGGGRGWTA